ncbi:MAG: hypothetical protein ACLUOB_03070 [Subdoligranulum sp.]
MDSRNAADAGAYCHRVVLSWALFPVMVATGTDRIFANLFWMGGDDLEEMKSGLSSQKGITMLRQHRTIPALRLKHRSGGCGTASALPKCSIMSGCGTRIVLRGQKPLALCDRCPCFGSLFPPLAALTFAASSIICAFGLASAAPRSPYRHLELCGIALRILNDTTKKHRTKICLVLFGAPAGIRIPDTLIKRAHRAEHSDFRSFELSLFLCKAS